MSQRIPLAAVVFDKARQKPGEDVASSRQFIADERTQIVLDGTCINVRHVGADGVARVKGYPAAAADGWDYVEDPFASAPPTTPTGQAPRK